MDLEPPVVKRRKIDTDHCIICFKPLNPKKQEVVTNPTFNGLSAIFKASQIRKDDVYESIWPLQQDILSLDLKVSFHKLCRAKYTSKSNISTSNPSESDQQPCTSAATEHTRISRNETAGFDIRNNCFICGKSSTSRNKLTPVSTGTGQSTREKVLAAADKRQDNKIHMRMLAFPDLFAYDAKYHRLCYSHYISERNITAAIRKSGEETMGTLHDEAFDELKCYLEQTVFSKTKTVTPLVHLKDEYVGYLVSLGDALRKATILQSMTDEPEYEDIPSDVPSAIDSEMHTLHAAAGILRKHMADIEHVGNMYAPVEETDIQHCAEFVPNTLYDFIQWCTSEKSHTNVTSCGDEGVMKNNLRTIAICHNIISQSRRVYSTITLGLALQVHHELGSKHLIDMLHELGHCVSYDEVRRFLTSVAVDQTASEDIYIPKVLQNLRCIDEYPIVDAAIDNFDQNEATLDGKSTTHAMAAVLFYRGKIQHDNGEGQGIPRLPRKSLSVGERALPWSEDLQRYNKPAKRPEPPPVNDVSLIDVDKDSSELKAAESKDLAWKVYRIANDEKQAVPSWTASNAFLSERNLPVATTCYLPFIRAPPTDLSTIYTILLRLVQIAAKLGQPHILVTADCAIYSKAQQIMWNKPAALDGKLTMRLGGMHLTMSFVASIGKLYGDGGLLSMLVDSDVYAPATAKLVLQGK
uniref:uncharacterized protein n=1 Tax=Myxine glutinosa TaxID=7769 RepID=UPI00358F875D